MKTVILLLAGLLPVFTATATAETVVRIGHFPNVTHAQALVARSFAREGKDWFEERLGNGAKVEWFAYNAGPSAMEAVFARSIDLSYVGPSPAINAYTRSRGEEVRIISGAANGGASLVVQGDSPIKTGADFKGRTIATPQLGNTQDVAARAYLKENGIRVTLTGGEARVIPTANPEQLSLFSSKRIDAVWTVEPWVSRLLREAGGRIFIEEKDAVTTVLIARAAFLKDQPELVKKVAAAHRELTDWIKANPEEAQKRVVSELSALTRSRVSPELIAEAWPRILLTNEVDVESLKTYVRNAEETGFLRNVPPLDRLISQP